MPSSFVCPDVTLLFVGKGQGPRAKGQGPRADFQCCCCSQSRSENGLSWKALASFPTGGVVRSATASMTKQALAPQAQALPKALGPVPRLAGRWAEAAHA
ncbi:hypothetical protein THAOC_08940 [Thalassiosira oceanica]|uniref:Uncharacterized protein n=1 Tax=Thalassiosira oceanica TaxID=159749 RepID=K0TH46_THAOC|nr:hypothetical protein THAOC_08940 [Thalassiosira oceanica]|eukprot:EJK69767.1 hypothetical protein THAOC_08940 [Thalassiosira oceanica]